MWGQAREPGTWVIFNIEREISGRFIEDRLVARQSAP
jgi:hypothetical protein